jgi:hypothetical protein
MKQETRSLREAPALDGKRTLAGYAAVFNSEADIGGYFREVIAPGAFEATLKDADVRALVVHDSGRLIGRKSNGTLRLSEDKRGLKVEIDLPDTSDGRDVAALVERGDMDGMSFGFMVTREEWDETQAPPKRTIHEVSLREVSAVTFPAYDDTTLALRTLEGAQEEARKAREQADKKADSYFKRKAETENKFRRL